MLKIGKISYLNVYPLYNFVENCKLIKGEPSYLNKLLRYGEIDVSPSSSFEYIKNPNHYLILKNFSISSRSRVLSVVAILKSPIEELESQELFLSPASATTNVLFQIILKEFYKFSNVRFKYLSENRFNQNVNHILIGDEALKIYFKKNKNYFIYDIGELWFKFTSLPFVFALWLINKNSIKNKEKEFNRFVCNLNYNKNHIVIPEKYENFTEKQIKEYFEFLDYNLTDLHLKSLNIFAELCLKYHFINRKPEFNFYK